MNLEENRVGYIGMLEGEGGGRNYILISKKIKGCIINLHSFLNEPPPPQPSSPLLPAAGHGAALWCGLYTQ